MMTSSRSCGLHLVFLLLSIIKYSLTNSTYGKYEYAICPADDSNFRVFSELTIRECVKKCATRPVCKAVGYNRTSKTCSLHIGTNVDLAVVSNAQCVQVRMDTVNLVELSGGCNCANWEVCNIQTGSCDIEECDPSLPGPYKILGNTASTDAKKKIRCIGSQDTQPLSCHSDGSWSSNSPDCTPGITNVAVGKPAVQISNYVDPWGNYTAYLGVDGITNQYLSENSCFSTEIETNPWWRVDLLYVSYIDNARLYNRINADGGVAYRASNISIDVGETIESLHQVVYIDGVIDDIHNLTLPIGTYARIVSLTAHTTEHFHLCEVEIYGYSDTVP